MIAGFELHRDRLNALLKAAGQPPLSAEVAAQFAVYLALFLRWNEKTNLSAIRDEEGILRRHFVESIACARALPSSVRTLLDFGSGAGLPGLPIALCRPEIAVTLAESQGKKAAFLREAVRVLGLAATVHAARAEGLTVQYDCLTLRAVDRMEDAVRVAARLVAPGGWLVLMTTASEQARQTSVAGEEFLWAHTAPLPGSEDRLLALGERRISSPA